MATAQEEYTALIHNRVVNPLSEDVYGETHHIYPRCLGGNDEPENLVKLTPEEHYRAHCLLPFIYTEGEGHMKLCCAWNRMRFAQGKDVEISEEEYGELKRQHAEVMRNALLGKPSRHKGHAMSQESREKISQHTRGKKRTAETRAKIAAANKGKKRGPHTEEWKRHNSEISRGRKLPPFSEEHRRKLSEAHKGKATWNKGKHYTEEQRKHISEGLKAMYAARKQRG